MKWTLLTLVVCVVNKLIRVGTNSFPHIILQHSTTFHGCCVKNFSTHYYKPADKRDMMEQLIQEFNAQNSEAKNTLMKQENDNTRETSDKKIKELSNIIETRDKELDFKKSTIRILMSTLKKSTNIRSELETTLQKVRQEIDIERDGVKAKERKMNARTEQLVAVVRDKEDELSKQMSTILEMRNEKERLQDKIQGIMQNMIDNIQKELTGRSAPAPRIQPEQGDNAVMLTPGPKSSEVNRRCEAMSRGERVPPLALKRRIDAPIRYNVIDNKNRRIK